MIPTAEHNRLAPKTDDLSVAPVYERKMPNSDRAVALPEFALLLQKELEKFRPNSSEEEENHGSNRRFFEEYMTLLYGQNRMVREISESKPMNSQMRDMRHTHQSESLGGAGFRAYIQEPDREHRALYHRYQNLYDSPAGTGFERSF